MFTGIVKGRAIVEKIDRKEGLSTLTLRFPDQFDQGLEVGASVAVDGVCLTVTEHAPGSARFDVMQESLVRTTLVEIEAGDAVNVERAARDGAEIGGHPLSGHVDCTAWIETIETPENNTVIRFSVGPEFIRYIFPKGYIAINGTSLTVSNVIRKDGSFDVWFIPETLRATTFSEKKVGDRVNIEIERATQVTVDTIRSYLEERFGHLLPRLEALLEAEGVHMGTPPAAAPPSSTPESH